ncbi:unnamed protein product, partial [Prunus brigantina]
LHLFKLASASVVSRLHFTIQFFKDSLCTLQRNHLCKH